MRRRATRVALAFAVATALAGGLFAALSGHSTSAPQYLSDTVWGFNSD